MAMPSPNNPVKRAIDQRAARVPRKKRARYTAAAYETAPVEANWQNPSHGDADSEGWRQERRSLYKDPTNLTHSVDRFFNELAQNDRGQPSYELAADTQRPAAQYRGRYKAEHRNALALLHAGSSVPPTRSSTSSPGRVPQASSAGAPGFDQTGYDKAVRRQRVAELLQHGGRGSSALFRTGVLSTAAVDRSKFVTAAQPSPGPNVPTATTPARSSGDASPSSSDVSKALKAAHKYLGVHEDNGTNRSPSVDQLEKGFGMVGQPWCGIYVGTVLKHAGVQNVDSRVASVAEIETMARNHDGAFAGGFHSAKHARAGDALITKQGQHVALVEKVDRDGTIHVIGGNQGTGAVTRGTWKPDQVYGVARPNYRRR